MSDSDLDPIVGRAVDELRRLPVAEPAAIARVVAASAAARLTPADEPLIAPPRERSITKRLVVGGCAAAVVALATLGAWQWRARVSAPVRATAAIAMQAPASTAGQREIREISSADVDASAVAHQFVFQSSAAHTVAVVGDFNAWNPADAEMTRSGTSNLWSITLPIAPGRHVYGFMIDDTLFSLDPQAPKARDPDLGTNGSVIIVGKP